MAAAPDVKRYRFTVNEYLEMGKVGILNEDSRVELIDGEIVELSPIDDPHLEAVNRCTHAFAGADAAGWLRLSVQNPVRIDPHNHPQPDVVLARPGTYGAPHPADVLLLIEVADSSLRYDRQTKLPLYARAGIPEAWLLDLNGETLEVHRQPGPQGYGLVQPYRRGQRVAPQELPDLEVAVDDLLP